MKVVELFFFTLLASAYVEKKNAGIILYGGESKSRPIDEIGDLFDVGGQIKDRSLKVANWKP